MKAPGAKFPPEVAKRRQLEQSRRAANAQQLAFRTLRNRHDVEYQELYEEAKRFVNEKAGPLPGDDNA